MSTVIKNQATNKAMRNIKQLLLTLIFYQINVVVIQSQKSNLQPYVFPVGLTKVVVGSTHMFECRIQHISLAHVLIEESFNVLWFKDGINISDGTEILLPVRFPRHVVQISRLTTSTTLSTLTIFDIMRSDTGSYTCKIEHGMNTGLKTNTSPFSRLETLYLPTNLYPECSYELQNINTLDASIVMTCRSGLSNPPVNMQWRNELGELTSSSITRSGEFSTLTTVVPMAICQRASYFTCSITSAPFRAFNKSCTVALQAPRVVIIPQRLYAEEKQSITLMCSSQSKPSANNFVWTFSSLPFSRYSFNHDRKLLILSNIHFNDDGLIIRCVAANDFGTGRATTILNVRRFGDPLPTVDTGDDDRRAPSNNHSVSVSPKIATTQTGGSVTFDCRSRGDRMRYEWFMNDAHIDPSRSDDRFIVDSTQKTLQIRNISRNDNKNIVKCVAISTTGQQFAIAYIVVQKNYKRKDTDVVGIQRTNNTNTLIVATVLPATAMIAILLVVVIFKKKGNMSTMLITKQKFFGVKESGNPVESQENTFQLQTMDSERSDSDFYSSTFDNDDEEYNSDISHDRIGLETDEYMALNHMTRRNNMYQSIARAYNQNECKINVVSVSNVNQSDGNDNIVPIEDEYQDVNSVTMATNNSKLVPSIPKHKPKTKRSHPLSKLKKQSPKPTESGGQTSELPVKHYNPLPNSVEMYNDYALTKHLNQVLKHHQRESTIYQNLV